MSVDGRGLNHPAQLYSGPFDPPAPGSVPGRVLGRVTQRVPQRVWGRVPGTLWGTLPRTLPETRTRTGSKRRVHPPRPPPSRGGRSPESAETDDGGTPMGGELPAGARL